MKPYLLPILALYIAACNSPQKSQETAEQSAGHQLVQKWETDSLLKTPESVFFDKANNVLYVSNIDGKEPWAADGKGSIAKVGTDGTIIAAEWITGLHAPKGMGMHNGKLYVADLTNLVTIDIATGKIESTYPVPGAVGLNDITTDSDGVIYISDSQGKQVFRYNNDKSELFLKDLKGPNGILVHEKVFYILDNGGLYRMNEDKTLTSIAEGMEGNTDGIENIVGNDFIVSCWAGAIWYVHADGSKQLLLDTQKDGKNTADIGIDRETRTIYVPTFSKNSVVAYEVK